MVPESAIQASERGFVTYVVKEKTARLRPVGLGLRTGTGVVEILSGLEAGEMRRAPRGPTGSRTGCRSSPSRAREGRAMSEPNAAPDAGARGPAPDRDRDDARGHLDPQPRVRLDPDVRAHRLRPADLHGLRDGVQGPRHQPEPRRRLPGRERLGHLGRRLARDHRDRRRRHPGGGGHLGRGRQGGLLDLAPGRRQHHRRVRARARHRRRDAGHPEQDLPGAEPAAARHRPADRQQVEPRGRADHAARARGQPPAHLRRRLHPQRDPAAAPDDPRHRRDPAAGLPRPQRARLVRRRAARGPGPHRAGRQQRDPARAPRGAGRPDRERRRAR